MDVPDHDNRGAIIQIPAPALCQLIATQLLMDGNFWAESDSEPHFQACVHALDAGKF